MLSTSKSMFRNRRRKSVKQEGGSEMDGTAKATPTVLFPLPELLEQLLRQEAELWKKNEGLQSAIKGGQTTSNSSCYILHNISNLLCIVYT